MILLYFAQLLIGTIIALGLFGYLLNGIQRILSFMPYQKFFLLSTIIISIVNCGIAFYYSECVNIYQNKHNSGSFMTFLTMLLLVFVLNGPAKYANSKEERQQTSFTGIIGLFFYILIRYFPEIGNNLFGWLPIYIWV